MGWADRLRNALAGCVPSADSAESADRSGAGTGQRAIGAIGTNDTAAFSVNCPATADEPASPPRLSAESLGLADMHAGCDARMAALIGAFNHPDVAADRAAIAAETLLPAPGTPERNSVDARQHEAVAGLVHAALHQPGTLSTD